ncbi:MAG: GGDEF domain-containing protein [Acidobacteria bacterium]|nr:GGDEF domain-containing protein [Acidobacteriota bacterium]MBI3661914.1 GGDEF domain-containing protein [Acidobacteriota bacterium]
MTAQDSFLDLLIETLQALDRPVRGQFLQRFFKSIAQVELPEAVTLDLWEQILLRRQELSENLGKPISLKTAIVDVLASTNFLRTPVLMEYEELKKLQVNAATDALTGLYNRRLFEEYFAKELTRAKRYNQHMALVMMDLHKFKEVNDRFGHLQGDQALQLAAATLRKTLRTSDYAFRIGGDEFALLLLQCDPEQASTLSRRLRANYESAIAPLKFDVPLALDFGVSIYPEDGENKESLIRVADERLYELKNANRVASASSRVIPIETPTVREAAQTPTPVMSMAAAAASAAAAKSGAERRKWERVSLVGTRAYAVLHDNTEKTARVLDLSYGGVALQFDPGEEAPQSFHAVLHVPILPPVRVSLKKTYVHSADETGTRIGCAFVS